MYNDRPGMMDGISRLSGLQSRSICAENPTGEKGKGGMATEGTGANAARDLGRGWKVSPSLNLKAHSVTVLADITGEGAPRRIHAASARQGRAGDRLIPPEGI